MLVCACMSRYVSVCRRCNCTGSELTLRQSRNTPSSPSSFLTGNFLTFCANRLILAFHQGDFHEERFNFEASLPPSCSDALNSLGLDWWKNKQTDEWHFIKWLILLLPVRLQNMFKHLLKLKAEELEKFFWKLQPLVVNTRLMGHFGGSGSVMPSRKDTVLSFFTLVCLLSPSPSLTWGLPSAFNQQDYTSNDRDIGMHVGNWAWHNYARKEK